MSGAVVARTYGIRYSTLHGVDPETALAFISRCVRAAVPRSGGGGGGGIATAGRSGGGVADGRARPSGTRRSDPLPHDNEPASARGRMLSFTGALKVYLAFRPQDIR
jgi:hypothetical protein